MKITDSQRIDRLYQKIARLTERVNNLDEWSNGADEMLTELNHALPDPEYDAKCAENAIVVEESLARHAVRLGLKKIELTGSDLCHAMLRRGDSWVLIKPSDHSDVDAMSNNEYPKIVTGFDGDGFYCAGGRGVEFGVPINNQGEPLTQSDVGL